MRATAPAACADAQRSGHRRRPNLELAGSRGHAVIYAARQRGEGEQRGQVMQASSRGAQTSSSHSVGSGTTSAGTHLPTRLRSEVGDSLPTSHHGASALPNWWVRTSKKFGTFFSKIRVRGLRAIGRASLRAFICRAGDPLTPSGCRERRDGAQGAGGASAWWTAAGLGLIKYIFHMSN
jgi:hypothetical protein